MEKVLITGSTGMLGFAVSSYFGSRGYPIVQLSRHEFDIATDPIGKFESFLDGVDVVVNCAGIIKPMISGNTLETVLKVNSVFPRNLANLCSKREIKCFHITTDCVYSGRKGQYTEDDYFDAEDIYGLSKNAGENKDCMVIRTSIIGEERNQSRSLLEWAKSQAGKEVNGFTNHLWNGVTTLYLAAIIEDILLRKLYQKGIFHVHSPNVVTKLELLQIFDQVYGLKLKISPAQAKEACDRSLASIYPLTREVATRPVLDQVKEMREFFLKSNKRRTVAA